MDCKRVHVYLFLILNRSFAFFVFAARVSKMGLLSLGSPLDWSETKKYADHVRKHGILQFLHIYNKLKDRENDCLKWGDEVNRF